MKGSIAFALLVAALAAAGWFIWQWGFCRFYVGPDEMAVITARVGEPLPPGEILAKPGQQGIQADVLGEGRHFRNPWMFDHLIRPVVNIAPGKVGIVTAKVGADLPQGEFLARPGQKGIWRNVLGPGKYRMNPFGYEVEVVDAINVPIGYVGVITGLSGDQAPAGSFATPEQKGVRRDVLQPGLYFLNPKEVKCDVLEIGVNQVSLLTEKGGQVITKSQLTFQNAAIERLTDNVLEQQQAKRKDYLSQNRNSASSSEEWKLSEPVVRPDRQGKPIAHDVQNAAATLSLNQQVSFPSRDGFEIGLDMTVEFEFQPGQIPLIFQAYGDLPAVVDKIIMPQIQSVSRIKGSGYQAKDFIVGEGREKFQAALTEALAKILAEKNIIVHNALIRHVNVPGQILEPIQQASIATEQDLTNKEKQNTAKKQAELNTWLSMITQHREQVAQETLRLKAEIKADEEKQVAEIKATGLKQVAEIDRDTARVKAETTRRIGEAKASVTRMVEGEKSKGFELKTQAFGDPQAFALAEFADSLNPAMKINILHTGPGTLWTDLDKAKMSDLGAAAAVKSAPAKP